MRKLLPGIVLCMFFAGGVHAQDKIKQQLFYYSPKGITFIPPFSKPGLVYDGKLYMGRKQLEMLFLRLNDAKLNGYFDKYKANKTPADILGFTGNFILPVVNIFVSTNAGRVNWPLLLSGVVLGGTSGYLNMQAQKHLLYASIYYDEKMKAPHTHVPTQQSIGFAIPLGK